MYISLQPKYLLRGVSSMKTNNQTKNGDYKEPNLLELTEKLRSSPAFIFWTIYDTCNKAWRAASCHFQRGGWEGNE